MCTVWVDAPSRLREIAWDTPNFFRSLRIPFESSGFLRCLGVTEASAPAVFLRRHKPFVLPLKFAIFSFQVRDSLDELDFCLRTPAVAIRVPCD